MCMHFTLSVYAWILVVSERPPLSSISSYPLYIGKTLNFGLNGYVFLCYLFNAWQKQVFIWKRGGIKGKTHCRHKAWESEEINWRKGQDRGVKERNWLKTIWSRPQAVFLVFSSLSDCRLWPFSADSSNFNCLNLTLKKNEQLSWVEGETRGNCDKGNRKL